MVVNGTLDETAVGATARLTTRPGTPVGLDQIAATAGPAENRSSLPPSPGGAAGRADEKV
jgi:hypothetical protein